LEEYSVGIVSKLFGSQQAGTKAGQARTGAAGAQPDRDVTRRQLLATAVRDTLRTQGIPAGWLTTETLTAATSGKERGMHLRLILRDHRLMEYAMDLQKNVSARIVRLDPLSAGWMAGISWKLDLAEDASFAQLPDAGHWQRLISNPPAPAAKPTPNAEPQSVSPRVVLEQLFSPDGPLSRGKDRPDFSATQPMGDTRSAKR
jgi:hypothetical protein